MSSPTAAEPAAKRQKLDEQLLPFHSTLLARDNVDRLRTAHAASAPYKHAVVDQLFDEDFLKRARKEITEQLSFRLKETDIYKINQTGDLSNLSGLPASELALLPTLLELRDALYSKEFRSFVQEVTGCGPLSGIKTDMSCAEYSEGCYLLNHDDVIGTRRISFILYLVLDEPAWQPEWGGALELYPVLEADEQNPDRPNVPVSKPSVVIPPAFNQFVFFEVQPGHSFHSVEEVVVEGDKQKGGVGARVSLSGWFHKPIEGEEGYEGSDGFKPKSSLQQLYATTLSAATPYPELLSLPLPTIPSTAELAYLQPLVNSAYLTPKVVSHLRTQFCESSHLVLADFLAPSLASEIEVLIRARDAEMEKGRRGVEVGGSITNKVPSHTAGESEADGWTVVGPPHLQRYLSLSPTSTTATDRLSSLLRQVHDLFTSSAFAALLASLTSLLPTAYTTAVRRFRPGLDYTLARGESASDEAASAKLDVGLGLTPELEKEEEREKWESGEVGGWDIWLANEEGGDEATYGGGGAKKEENGDGEAGEKQEEQLSEQPAEETGAEEEEEEDDGPLLALEPEWNRLHLVLRDPGVLSFVKYVSARAPSSRWDVVGEWEVQGVEEEEEA
ncbi:RHTO0S11e01552g1_1 [Rhodotorula toruloides]|uniref:uS12 prolyl 3,4-dihydroxylase n=1 Tax=Rhodotorula toruloides TaxID=5286 RepID=A0A061B7Z7_RHOTO|nr:RHTO0S11e01552g1_1 [Rhodotorula toruloides]